MNTHAYEALGDEFFQMLCQALLVREFPNVQCYPVGMPDGGRDASVPEQLGKGSIVFQVKFARQPEKIKDVAEWVISAIEGEKEKTERLAARGAHQYVLMTNVQGSSHLDVGQMDRVQAHMSGALPMAATCWWRGDLDRRLENAYDLKLRYPSVLSGPDLLRLLWEAALQGDSEGRRKSALNAYLSYHLKEESTVRFKQIELISTSLLDLYIDVPAVPSGGKQNSVRRTHFQRAQRRIALEEYNASDPRTRGQLYQEQDGTLMVAGTGDGRYARVEVGGADLLTDPEFASRVPFSVVEGAPGQGKSTLTQYLAQLQRSRLLNRHQDVERFPARHRRAPMAIPFRLELRDLAVWLKGIDPWTQ